MLAWPKVVTPFPILYFLAYPLTQLLLLVPFSFPLLLCSSQTRHPIEFRVSLVLSIRFHDLLFAELLLPTSASLLNLFVAIAVFLLLP